jgi:hypothetical protein
MSQFMSNSSAYDLRPVKVQDQEFLSRVYAGTRAEELALTNWDEKQKSSFLQMHNNNNTSSLILLRLITLLNIRAFPPVN